MADIINNNPWLGLSSYKYEDASRFYGRDRELQELANIVRQNSFTTIYGVSGAGKTSIINAGLFPMLDKENFLPIYIRLNHGEGRIGYDKQMISAVENALTKANAESELTENIQIDSELDKLWLYFHSHRFWTSDNHKLIPILFIDQFEEIFTKNEDVNDVWSFFNIIDSLQYNLPPERILTNIQETGQCVTFGEEMNFRVVFSMREDFLPRLEDYCFDIPAMRRNRVGLKPLNGLQALEVITKPRPGVVSREVALHIISKIVGKHIKDDQRRLEATSVDTSILSLFCTELYNYGKIDENGGSITIPLVDLYGGNILEWFYDRNMQVLPKKTYVYLENQLLTHSGFRNSVALEDLLENGVTQDHLDSLEENRIVRIEDVNHSLRVEFTHDILCKIAKKRKDERDSVERAKGETSARKAFTLDTSFFFLIVFSFFLSLYYVGFSTGAFLCILSMPVVFLIFMFFAHRHVADKNFSTMFWTLFGSIGFIAGFTSFNPIEKLYSIRVYRTMYEGYLFILPLLFVFSPLILNIHRALSLDHRGKKLNFFFVAIIFILFCIESFALGYWVVDNRCVDINLTAWIKLLLYETPLCLLVLSPAVILYRKKKNATPWNIATVLYCYFEVAAVVLLAIGENHHWYNEKNVETFIMPWMLTCGCICVLYAFYGIQYMRQPKEQAFMTYCNNVLSFQSFKKYKSFRTRLKTIAIVFFVAYIGLTSTSYNDYVPFISLPLCCILVLYVASKEINMTKKKHVLTRKLIIPIVFLTELIVVLQYTDGYIKQGIIYMSTLILAIGIFVFLAHQEFLKGNKALITKLAGVSFFVAFVLPSLCVGYNIFNPLLSNISRVWDGRISSNLTGFNFLAVENEKGEKGVMDYSEIIIVPQFNSINKRCYISREMYRDMHPVESFFKKEIFMISYFREDWGYDVDREKKAKYLSFMCTNTDGGSSKYIDNTFLITNNKYGRYITEDWLECCNMSYNMSFNEYDCTIGSVDIGDKIYQDTREVEKDKQNKIDISFLLNDGFDYKTANDILSSKNQNIDDAQRQNAVVRLFVINLHNFIESQNSSIGKDLGFVLKKCYTSMSLDPLLSYKGSNVSSTMIINTIVKIAPLLRFDQTGALKDLIFGRIWDKYVKENAGIFKSLCFLLANEKAKALSIVNGEKVMSPELCIIYLYTNNRNIANNMIEEYVNSNNYKTNEAEDFFVKIAELYSFLKRSGYEIVDDKIIKDVAKGLHIGASDIIVDCTELSIPSEGGTYYVQVNSLLKWYVESPTADWIEWTQYDDYVKIELDYNYGNPREDNLILTSALDNIRIKIKQK